MISDPVRGLARRHGSVVEDELVLDGDGLISDIVADTASTRVLGVSVGGVEYDLVLRRRASTSAIADKTLVQCFNKETRKFIPVQIGDDATVALLVSGGVSAAVNVGRYAYIAGNSIVTSAIETAKWATTANKQLMVGWVRQGAYSRTFTVTLRLAGGTAITGSYKTKSSSYPELLDTSGISWNDNEDNTNYQKQINDATNLYNSQVTAWIGEAAEDITPANIAEKLVGALVTNGATGVTAVNGYIVVNNSDYTEIELDDGGDSTLVRPVGNTIDNVDLISSRHFVGKVVKVQPEDNVGDPVYLEAVAKDGVSTGFAEVVWEECAGYEMQPDVVFCMGTVEGGTLYLAGGPAELAALSGVAVPTWEPNAVGDGGSAPLPAFFGQVIHYLGMFQDRLIISAGSTIMFSRTGDYLNLFRQSVLTIEDDDPWEGYALGAEDDVIRYSALYDRSLLLFGDKFQYIINGKQAFTPSTANIAIAASYPDATDANPVTAGNYVFYCKWSGRPGQEVTSLGQLQTGVVSDQADTYPASQALDRYLDGTPVELMTMTAPNFLFLRTSKSREKVYVYTYLDNPSSGERLFDSWSSWAWSPDVGELIGMSQHKSDALFYMVKSRGDEAWVSCERFVRDTDLSDFPYLDSLRPYSNLGSGFVAGPEDGIAVAFDNTVEEFLLGARPDLWDEFLGSYPDMSDAMWVGYEYSAYGTPTNPYIKDTNGQAILSGRLTLRNITVAVADTGGMTVSVSYRNLTQQTLNFTGRVLAGLKNLVGRQPVVTTNLSAMVGREVKECTYTLAAVKWLPLTITAIDWTGLTAMRTRRV